MPLPVSQDRSGDQTAFRSKSVVTENHPTFTAIAEVTIGDILILWETNERPYVGYAEDSAAIGEEFQADISEGIEISIDSDEIPVGETFPTKNADVWYNNTTKMFSPTENVGWYCIGTISQVQDANGVCKFLKYRFAEIGDGT